MYQPIFERFNAKEKSFWEALSGFMKQHDVHIEDYEGYDDDEESTGSTLHFWSNSSLLPTEKTIMVEIPVFAGDPFEIYTNGVDASFARELVEFLRSQDVKVTEDLRFVSVTKGEENIDIAIEDLAED